MLVGGWDGSFDMHDTMVWFLTVTKNVVSWGSTNIQGDALPGTIAMGEAIYDARSSKMVIIGGSRYPRQEMFWPPVGSLDKRGQFSVLTHAIFQSRGVATATISTLAISSEYGCNVSVLVSETAGVSMAEQGDAPYPRVGQTLSRLGHQALVFGGVAPFSTYYFNTVSLSCHNLSCPCSIRPACTIPPRPYYLCSTYPRIHVPTCTRTPTNTHTRPPMTTHPSPWIPPKAFLPSYGCMRSFLSNVFLVLRFPCPTS